MWPTNRLVARQLTQSRWAIIEDTHRELFFYSPGPLLVGTANLNVGGGLPGENTPHSIQIYMNEACAPTFTDVQLYMINA